MKHDHLIDADERTRSQPDTIPQAAEHITIPRRKRLFRRPPHLLPPLIERQFILERDQPAVIRDALHFLHVAGFSPRDDPKSKHKKKTLGAGEPIHLTRGTLSYARLFWMPSPRFVATDVSFAAESLGERRTSVSMTYAVAEMARLQVVNTSIKFWNAEVDEFVHTIKHGTLDRSTSRRYERRATLLSLVLNHLFFAGQIMLAMLLITPLFGFNRLSLVSLLFTAGGLLLLFMAGFLRVILALGLRR